MRIQSHWEELKEKNLNLRIEKNRIQKEIVKWIEELTGAKYATGNVNYRDGRNPDEFDYQLVIRIIRNRNNGIRRDNGNLPNISIEQEWNTVTVDQSPVLKSSNPNSDKLFEIMDELLYGDNFFNDLQKFNSEADNIKKMDATLRKELVVLLDYPVLRGKCQYLKYIP